MRQAIPILVCLVETWADSGLQFGAAMGVGWKGGDAR